MDRACGECELHVGRCYHCCDCEAEGSMADEMLGMLEVLVGSH